MWSYYPAVGTDTTVLIAFPDGLEGRATLLGDTLFIAYSDWLDWEPEVYVRVREP